MEKIIIMAIILNLMMPGIVSAGTTKIYPSDDAFVRANAPNTNYNNDDLRVGNPTGDGKHRTFLKFDLSGLNASLVNSAVLSIDPVSEVGNPNVKLYYISSDSWTENTITWNNMPVYSSLNLIDSKIISSGERIGFNVSSLMNEGDRNLSLALISGQESTSGIYVQFFSSEQSSGQTYWPYLEVDYDGIIPGSNPADTNEDGHVSLTEYNDFKYAFKNGLISGVSLTEYNDIKYAFKNGLLP